jgi:hypothetical protein
MNASAPTTSRFGPLKRIHCPRVPLNPPMPRMLAWSSFVAKRTPDCISPRSGAFVVRSRFCRMNKYSMPLMTTNGIRTGSGPCSKVLPPYSVLYPFLLCGGRIGKDVARLGAVPIQDRSLANTSRMLARLRGALMPVPVAYPIHAEQQDQTTAVSLYAAHPVGHSGSGMIANVPALCVAG